MGDVVELILAEHEQIRGCLGTLSQPGRAGFPAATLAVARRLAGLLDQHTRAEQEIVHPALWDGPAEIGTCVLAAVADHDDIQEIALETCLQPAGCAAWRQAVLALRRSTTRHLAWEERVLLPALCRNTRPAARGQLGRQWSAFSAARAADARGLAYPAARTGPG
jgi:ribosomal protein S12 methylthiotransferase accessory factor YcaO